ncbi:hypothetical protein B566_EDAN007039 [Ephemera danica]|nr:hypothetical protein B566_EDAN007039 [Ephemera danica]
MNGGEFKLKLIHCVALQEILKFAPWTDAEDSSDEEFQEVEAKEGFEASIGDALLADMILQREQQRSQQTQVAASASTPVAGPSRSNVQQLSEAGPSRPNTNQVWLSAASGSQAEEAAPPQVSSIPIEFPSTSQPCPLHGRVVPRDELGRCSRPEDARAEEERRLLHQQQHPDWQDPKLLAELEKQTGIDLKMPVKGQHKKKRPEFPGLTDLKRKSDSPRERLAKKLFKK